MVRTDKSAILKNVLYEDTDGVNGFFLDYLEKNFGEDSPIFIKEIKLDEYSQMQIINMIADLCRCGKLNKFDEET